MERKERKKRRDVATAFGAPTAPRHTAEMLQTCWCRSGKRREEKGDARKQIIGWYHCTRPTDGFREWGMPSKREESVQEGQKETSGRLLYPA